MILIFLQILTLLPYLLILFILDSKNKDVHLYGIYGYFGLPGKGKTISMCRELSNLRKKYGSKIYIMTNFYYSDEDFHFNSWKDLLVDYDKPLVVAWDEVQNEFNSRDFKNFPISLLTLLTQVRKKNGIRILYTSQRWHFVDKNFRSLSFGCYDCYTIFNRFTFTKMYDPIDYDSLQSSSDFDKKRKIKPLKYYSFLQSSFDRNSYDSYKMLESAKSREYLDRAEQAQIDTRF